jgi:ketosteroid isomerase-like protein
MNMNKHTAWLLATLLCVSALPAFADTDDEAAVVQTLREMYVALTQDDHARLRAVTTSDFYAFDGGLNLTGDELVALIERLHGDGKIFVWTVTEPKVRFAADTAWITYLNRGSVEDAAGKKAVSWLESAVLQKKKGTWRIQFLHSTRVPAK